MKDLDQAFKILREGNAMALELSRAASDRGVKLTATEFAILCNLSSGEELTVRQLEVGIGVSQSTISIALKKLSKRIGDCPGWVLAAGSIPGDKRTMRYKLNLERRKELRQLKRLVTGKLSLAAAGALPGGRQEFQQEETVQADDNFQTGGTHEQDSARGSGAHVSEQKVVKPAINSESEESKQLSLF